jgi:hypothetical protein
MPAMAAMLCIQANACDVCGGSSGSYLGILPRYNDHFVGLSFQYQRFTSTHPVMAGESKPVQSENYVRSLTAWGRFYPIKRLQVFAFVPYIYNIAVEPTETVVMNGLGDVKVLANYMLLNTADSSGNVKHTLLVGGGVKAPTGRNDVLNTEGIILSNMQAGTGSWDIIANANYTLRVNKAGINLDASYKQSTTNARDYRYGNKWNAGLIGFYWHDAGRISFLPQAGIRYEHSSIDYSSFYYRIRNAYSGGEQGYAVAGCGVYYGKWALTVTGNIPAWQHYAGGLVQAKPRLETQLQFLF